MNFLGSQILSSERKLLWLVETRKLFLKEIRQESSAADSGRPMGPSGAPLLPPGVPFAARHRPPDPLGAWPSGTEARGGSPSHRQGRGTKP